MRAIGSRCARVCGASFPGWLLLLALALSPQALAQAQAPPLLLPSALAYDAGGNLYIADAGRNQVFEASLAGALTVVAGSGTQGFAGDGGAGPSAELNRPQGLAFGPDGTLYIADTGNARIRALRAGLISTFAGTGVSAPGGDGGPPAVASFRTPAALAFSSSGALLVCDPGDQRVRQIGGGVVTTFAGNGTQGFTGDGGAANAAELDSPMGIAVASDGRVFVADTHNGRVRVIDASGTISTFAGDGQRGSLGDGGPAAAAELAEPRGVAMLTSGILLISESDGERVRSVNTSGIMATVVGDGVEGTSADGGSGIQVSLHSPRSLAISSFGQLALSDTLNGTVRVLTASGTLYRPAALVSGRVSSLQPSVGADQSYGQVNASLSVGGVAGPPQGAVVASEGGTTLATATLASGQAVLALPALDAGAHPVTLAYAGDGLNPAASSSGSSMDVAPALVVAFAPSTTVLYGEGIPAIPGTLTGVLPQDAGQVSVVFSLPQSATGAVGSYPLQATLTGPKSGNYAVQVGTGSAVLQVNQAGSTTMLSTLAPGYAGVPMRLTATIASVTTGKPTGSVAFLDGAAIVATAAVVNGSASALYVAPPTGSRNIMAQYSGDADFQPSNSATELAVVNTLPDFAVAITGASAASVPAGSIAIYNLAISAQPGPFTGVVTLSASGLPPGATAVFAPVQVVPGTSVANVTVSLQTPAALASLRTPAGGQSGTGLYGLAGVFFCSLWVRRSRVRPIALWGVCFFLCGCGARTVGEGAGGGTSQTYSVQLLGTSTNLLGSVVTHGTAVTLNVQN